MSLSVLRQTLIPVTLPAAWLYRAVVVARNQLYERGLCEVKQLPAPVVSVGNLTVGGSGKTPLVRRIAHHFLSKGWPVAVLSRGYRRRDNAPFVLVSDGQRLLASSFEAGDEALELARAVKGLAVAVGADRYHVGLELFRRLGPHLVVLDDGFQHRRLFR
ncbi:MAG: tetraacyldisaccharide 4'-kinase, partial [Acidobacteriota bacterium]